MDAFNADNLSSANVLETMCIVSIAIAVWFLEMQRRNEREAVALTHTTSSPNRCMDLFRRVAPELAGLSACLLLALMIRARGDVAAPPDAGTEEAWEEIKSEWPLLLTADSLLSLQAMLRLVVGVSVLLRSNSPSTSVVPLCEEPAALFMAAAVARVVLFRYSDAYQLDGPLGGALPMACELAVVPIWAVLGLRVLRRNLLSFALVLAAGVWFGSRNHLALADDMVADSLFTIAHVLESLAAFAYVCRTLLIMSSGCGGAPAPHVGFVHALLAAQQGLPAYYFLKAFAYSPELVGRGQPFAILQLGGAAQLGAFLAALALYSAEVTDYLEEEKPSSARVEPVAPFVAPRPAPLMC